MKKTVGYLHFAPAVLYMALIFCLSSRPAPQVAGIFPVIFHVKTGHCLEYALLALLLIYGFFKGTAVRPTVAYALAFLVAAAWGVSDEIHQSFVPQRSAAVMDVVSDCLGAGILAAIHCWLNRAGILSFRESD